MDMTADLAWFVDLLRAERLFECGASVVVSRAPGRLDVMGGIADYSGSLVLERPIAEATFAAVQLIDRPEVQIVSRGRQPYTLPLHSLGVDGGGVSYEDARQMFAHGDQWVAYVAGVMFVLVRERGARLTSGLRIVIASRVPEGMGVSSSAAVETATMFAVASVLGIRVPLRTLARLCQKAENLVAGAPCGVMDQMTCLLGDEHSLLALLCQPAQLEPPVPIPETIEFWGLDSGERHAVAGFDYGAVRAAAFMGLRILCEHAPVPGGYLANITPAEFEHRLARHLPEQMSGDEFLRRYGRTMDTVTRVEPHGRYPVRAATAYPIFECKRAEMFRWLLRRPSGERRNARLGSLMYDSHAGYGACGLGSSGTDRLVALVRAAGPAAGLYGARITGGGSGGTVAVLGRRDASGAIADIVDAYERETGYRPRVFAGSSPGAAAFGSRSITL